ncbi:hypothetical protein [Chamaesiphon sp. GL140_3_metabinner_50]|uniref:hypothetical protein n=1 Tax=Chamaesiphon sp. GL140_3_metabinner_50 TaxID=2970812 RepID=UPI0025D0D557|nr:hypothetical protein [Chamaesiphon sp. GL140_3_metabinner_50]
MMQPKFVVQLADYPNFSNNLSEDESMFRAELIKTVKLYQNIYPKLDVIWIDRNRQYLDLSL